ncbi:MAG: AbrB/MazE/SpoVT family DNA-binding domain-containing protein [Anaerolineales bacterium]|nr:MAG: AbrB/MazE/SpoVT family DNA-binding domain-containing protein [Anaerolineales bacterium]
MAMTKVQIRQRGTLTLPAKLRAKYNLEEGDVLTLVELEGAFFLSPKISVVPKLAAEIERLREEAGLSVEDLLEGLDEQRRRYYEERHGEAS